jgi:hypothetical protein
MKMKLAAVPPGLFMAALFPLTEDVTKAAPPCQYIVSPD